MPSGPLGSSPSQMDHPLFSYEWVPYGMPVCRVALIFWSVELRRDEICVHLCSSVVKPWGCAALVCGLQEYYYGHQAQQYVFSNIFPMMTTTKEVFQQIGAPIVKRTFDGYNCCIFAYGSVPICPAPPQNPCHLPL